MLERRRKKWINTKLQWALTKDFLATSSFSGMIGAIIGFFVGAFSGIRAAGIDNTTAIINWAFSPQATLILLGCMLASIAIGFIVWFAAVSTHKVAGPVYAIQRDLKRIREEGYLEPVRIRENDYLHDLVDDLNATLSELKEQEENLKNRIRELQATHADAVETLATSSSGQTSALSKAPARS